MGTMEKQEHWSKPGQRVRLGLQGQDSLYAHAYAGSEGWIRDHKHDDLGYPLVRVEWDKTHWAYNGEKDQWTYESHFEPVESTMSELPDGVTPEMLQAFSDFMKSQRDTIETPEQQQKKELEARFQEVLEGGLEFASESEAFVLMAIKRAEDDEQGLPTYAPRLYVSSRTPESGLLLDMQVAKYAATAHARAGLLAIEAVMKAGQE